MSEDREGDYDLYFSDFMLESEAEQCEVCGEIVAGDEIGDAKFGQESKRVCLGCFEEWEFEA